MVETVGTEETSSGSEKKGFTPGKGSVATLVLVAMLNIMGGAAVAPALPAISAAFPEAPETIISLVITLPPLAVVISGFFVGALADRFGKARTLAISLVVFTAAGLYGLVAPSLALLLAGRFVLGVAIAGIATASGALASEYYDEETRAKVYGWQSAATGASVLVLETTGGFLALINWRAPFWVYFIGVIFIVLTALFIREPDHSKLAPSGKELRGDSEPIEPLPAEREGDSSAASASAAEKVAATVGFVVATCLVGGFLSQTLAFLVPSKMPYLIAGFGQSTAVAGLILAVFGILNIIGGLASAPLTSRFRRSSVIVGCFSFIAFGCLLLALSRGVLLVTIGGAFVGSGVGCAVPLFMNWLASCSTYENSGKHMGSFATACNLGQFSTSLTAGAVLGLFGSHHAIFVFGAVVGAAVVIAAIALRSRIDGR